MNEQQGENIIPDPNDSTAESNTQSDECYRVTANADRIQEDVTEPMLSCDNGVTPQSMDNQYVTDNGDELQPEPVNNQSRETTDNDQQIRELYEAAQEVIEADDPLNCVAEAIRNLGYGGNLKPAMITYLSATSRLLGMRPGTMPVHLLLTGPSSAGKSYTLSVIKKLLPPAAYHEIDAGSQRVLIYDSESLQHRVLIFGEIDSLPQGEDNAAASAIRNLLQDHCLHYSTTIRNARIGNFEVQNIVKAGPTVLITTGTRELPNQLSTRIFTYEMVYDHEQISSALHMRASLEINGIAPQPPISLVKYQQYLQATAPVNVIVPFADALASAMMNRYTDPRVQRDYEKLLSLVKSVAILRQHGRERDQAQRIIAKIEDYETVRNLANDAYIETTGTPADIRRIVEAVAELTRITDGVSGVRLAEHLNINKMTVSRRVKKAINRGWLVNCETRRGYPARYAVGESLLPEDGLPTVYEINSNTVSNNNHRDVT